MVQEVTYSSTDWVANWISIGNIIVTLGLGTWIAYLIQNNVTKSRYVREYFIEELCEIKSDYAILFRELYNSEISAKTVSSRLKILSCRIQNLDVFIHQSYKLENSLLKDAHANFQQYITGTDEFNNQYSEDAITFSANTKTLLSREQSALVKAITQRVLDINSAKSKK